VPISIDDLPTAVQGLIQPAPLGIQQLRLPQPQRVVSRETEGLLHNDAVVPALTNRRDGGERVVQCVHGDAHLFR
jgi:hypothetical protein